MLRAQPDDRLVALAREGREPAFEEIVRRYRGGLVPFAAAFAPRDQAEDVVQESLVRAWGALRTSESEIRLKPWLYTIVRNRALNARRDTRTHEQLDETIDGVRQPSEIVLSKEELGRVVGAVNALPETQRKALVRSSLEGRTHEQLAAELQTSTGAVRQLIFRARGGLRESLGALLPLPLVRMLAESGMGDAAATGGGMVAAGSIGAAGGGSVAGKAATVAAIAAIAGGSGVAIDQASDGDDRKQSSNAALRSGEERPGGAGPLAGGSGAGVGSDDSSGGDSGPGGGSGEGREDRDQGEGSDDSGLEDSGSDDDRSGDDSSGPSDSSGSGSGDDLDGRDDSGGDDSGGSGHEERSGSSGSGSSGSGDDSSGSGSSGSGSGGSGSTGSGSDGSGSGGSGSSGSGSSGSESSEPDSSGSGSSGSGSGSGEDPLPEPEPELELD